MAKKKTYNMTMEQLEALERKGFQRGMKAAIERSLFIPIIVLRDEWGFGAKRIERFVEKVSIQVQALDEGYVTIKDLTDTLYEETGIKVEL